MVSEKKERELHRLLESMRPHYEYIVFVTPHGVTISEVPRSKK
jgi:hypothetical protein